MQANCSPDQAIISPALQSQSKAEEHQTNQQPRQKQRWQVEASVNQAE
jgi:hypothetical protein